MKRNKFHKRDENHDQFTWRLLLEAMKAILLITIIAQKYSVFHLSAARPGSISTMGMVLRNKRPKTHETSLYASMVDCM